MILKPRMGHRRGNVHKNRVFEICHLNLLKLHLFPALKNFTLLHFSTVPVSVVISWKQWLFLADLAKESFFIHFKGIQCLKPSLFKFRSADYVGMVCITVYGIVCNLWFPKVLCMNERTTLKIVLQVKYSHLSFLFLYFIQKELFSLGHVKTWLLYLFQKIKRVKDFFILFSAKYFSILHSSVFTIFVS